MRPELKARILEFNRISAERNEKASDMDILIGAILKLPLGQLKKLLSEPILAILKKYGYEI